MNECPGSDRTYTFLICRWRDVIFAGKLPALPALGQISLGARTARPHAAHRAAILAGKLHAHSHSVFRSPLLVNWL